MPLQKTTSQAAAISPTGSRDLPRASYGCGHPCWLSDGERVSPRMEARCTPRPGFRRTRTGFRDLPRFRSMTLEERSAEGTPRQVRFVRRSVARPWAKPYRDALAAFLLRDLASSGDWTRRRRKNIVLRANRREASAVDAQYVRREGTGYRSRPSTRPDPTSDCGRRGGNRHSSVSLEKFRDVRVEPAAKR